MLGVAERPGRFWFKTLTNMAAISHGAHGTIASVPRGIWSLLWNTSFGILAKVQATN